MFKTKSGILHERLLRDIQLSLGRYSTDVVFTSAGKGFGASLQPDLTLQIRNGQHEIALTVAIQISVANKPEYEAKKAAELWDAGIDRVCVVTRDKTSRKQVLAAVEDVFLRQAAGGNSAGQVRSAVPPGIRVLDYETCIDAGYDWGWLWPDED